jgi:hypothetical protein
MVYLENLQHRLGNLPGYVKAKVKGKPFHWTMTRKQMENKKRSFENHIGHQENQSAKRDRTDKLCELYDRKKELGPLTVDDMIYYKEYCLSEANRNVGEVNVNALQIPVGNTNTNTSNGTLPMKVSPKEDAGTLLAEAAQSLEILSQTLLSLAQGTRTHIERHRKAKGLQTSFLEEVARGKQLAESASQQLGKLTQDPEASASLRVANELVGTFNSLARELNLYLTYTKSQARENLKAAIRSENVRRSVNVSNAVQALRGSTNLQNLDLLGDYATALVRPSMPNRKSRVAQIKGASVPNWQTKAEKRVASPWFPKGGRRTRKNRNRNH